MGISIFDITIPVNSIMIPMILIYNKFNKIKLKKKSFIVTSNFIII